MADTSVVQLDWPVGPNGTILLRHAEQWDLDFPFVVVMYAIRGKEQEYGLRLDLDKQVFLDRLDYVDLNESLFSVAGKLCDMVADKLQHHH